MPTMFAQHPHVDRAPKRAVLGIEIVHDVDHHTDRLPGVYSETADSPFAIDRKERGDMRRHDEYRYFNPDLGVVGVSTTDPADEIRCRVDDAYKRAEAYNRGQWHYVGVRAVATVTFTDVLQRISSGGLYGIESDADQYLAEVADGQLAELLDELRAAGFDDREIDTAMASRRTRRR